VLRPLAVGLLIVGTACSGSTPSVRASVEPGATPGAPTIRLVSAQPAVDSADVTALTIAYDSRARRTGSAGAATLWTIMRGPGAAPMRLPAVIAYGAVPPGYVNARRPIPPPLGPGLYVVDVQTPRGHAIIGFRITPAGRIE
jgi:hypothetical protein